MTIFIQWVNSTEIFRKTGISPEECMAGLRKCIGQQAHYNQQFITESQSGFEGPAVFEPSSAEPIVFAQRRNNAFVLCEDFIRMSCLASKD